MFDFQFIDPRVEVREERTVRRQETQTVTGMTCRIMNSMAELCRLFHHRSNLLFLLDDPDADLASMSRLAERVDASSRGLDRHQQTVEDVYSRLTRLIVDKCAGGETLSSLDLFILQLRPYLPELILGKLSIYDLDRAYDWERGSFPDGPIK